MQLCAHLLLRRTCHASPCQVDIELREIPRRPGPAPPCRNDAHSFVYW
jgi:hypothetical protein